MPNPLELLRRPRPQMANDPADLYDMQGGLGDEAELRSILAQKAGTGQPEVGALNRLTSMYRGQQADTLEGMQPSPFQQEQTSAIQQGFGMGASSPVQDIDPVRSRNVYHRQQAQEKMRQPVQVAEMTQAGETARQNIAAKQGTDVAKINADSATDRSNNYTELMQMMQGQGRQIDSGSLPGKTSGGSFNFVNPVAAPNQQSTLNQLAVVRGNLQKSGGNPFANFAAPKSSEEANFVQIANNLLGQAQLDGDVKLGISSIWRDPVEAGKPLNELFASPDDESVPFEKRATPQEWAALVDLFTKVRGY